MNAATNQPSILKLRLGQSDQAGHSLSNGSDEFHVLAELFLLLHF